MKTKAGGIYHPGGAGERAGASEHSFMDRAGLSWLAEQVPLLEIKGLCKSHGTAGHRTEGLRDITLQIRAGEFIAIAHLADRRPHRP